MKNEAESNRRNFLKTGATAAGVLALGSPVGRALAASCGLTPPQTSGPFYPGEPVFHPDNDLTRIPGHAARAKGQVVYIQGKVLDDRCLPVKGAGIEIWQACATGRYNNPTDDNPAALDPDFKYWAEAYTGADGSYGFKTIIPGAYPADTDWMRPPHIHYKISCLGYQELVTQMYFKGNEYNDRDLILKAVPAAERERVTIDFTPSTPDLEPGSLTGNFDITLKSVRIS